MRTYSRDNKRWLYVNVNKKVKIKMTIRETDMVTGLVKVISQDIDVLMNLNKLISTRINEITKQLAETQTLLSNDKVTPSNAESM